MLDILIESWTGPCISGCLHTSKACVGHAAAFWRPELWSIATGMGRNGGGRRGGGGSRYLFRYDMTWYELRHDFPYSIYILGFPPPRKWDLAFGPNPKRLGSWVCARVEQQIVPVCVGCTIIRCIQYACIYINIRVYMLWIASAGCHFRPHGGPTPRTRPCASRRPDQTRLD